MSRKISDKTKQARNMGKGFMENYKPYILVSEINSKGTTSIIVDWKHGRGVHCLSQAEADWYYILRWDDDNIDIREQFPLCDENYSNDETVAIAKHLGYRHPKDDSHIMTTDFLVTERGGSFHAYSVKYSEDLTRRDKEKLEIEESYWRLHNVPFTVLYKTDANEILADNIRSVTDYYDERRVFDRYSMIRHKIAVKEYEADMESRFLDCDELDRIEQQNKRRIANVQNR